MYGVFCKGKRVTNRNSLNEIKNSKIKIENRKLWDSLTDLEKNAEFRELRSEYYYLDGSDIFYYFGLGDWKQYREFQENVLGIKPIVFDSDKYKAFKKSQGF